MKSTLILISSTHVRRRKLWDDGCEELRRNFDVRKHLKVKFIGEKGEDRGGPKRDFFFQIMEAMGNQHMRPKGSCTPKHNLMALQSKQFYLIGKIIALSVLNGGPAPKFFSLTICSTGMLEEPELMRYVFQTKICRRKF